MTVVPRRRPVADRLRPCQERPLLPAAKRADAANVSRAAKVSKARGRGNPASPAAPTNSLAHARRRRHQSTNRTPAHALRARSQLPQRPRLSGARSTDSSAGEGSAPGACGSPRQRRCRGCAPSPRTGTPMTGGDHLVSRAGTWGRAPVSRSDDGSWIAAVEILESSPTLGTYNRAQSVYR